MEITLLKKRGKTSRRSRRRLSVGAYLAAAFAVCLIGLGGLMVIKPS
jgi:hypothetical protein